MWKSFKQLKGEPMRRNTSHSKKNLLIISSLLVVGTSSAQQFGVRPSFQSKGIQQGAVEGRNESFNAKTADAIIAVKQLSRIKDAGLYKIDDAAMVRLSEGHTSNKGISEAIKSIISLDSFAAKDSSIKSINELRLLILSQLKEVDPYNLQVLEKSRNELETASQLDLMYLVMGLNPLALTAKAKENIILFLTEVNNSINNSSKISDSMRVAQEELVMQKGVTIELSQIQAAYRSQGGIAELFKTTEDITNIDVQGPNGTVMQVRMTLKKAQELDSMAHEAVIRLIELAKSPDVSAVFKSEAIKEVQNGVENASLFLKDNPLLDRSSSKFTKVKEEKDRVANDINELLSTLKDLGASVGKKGVMAGASRWIRKSIPLADKVIKDPVAWERTLKEKILEIDKSIVDGINRLDSNNQELGKLKAKALENMSDLQVKMAKTKLISDYLQAYIKEITKRGDAETANIIRSEVVPRIERDLNGAMSLYGVLTASVEAMNHLVSTNNLIITQSVQLRTVASPAIAITESIKEAGRDAEKVVKQSSKISKFVENQLQQMSEQIKKNNELFAKAAGETVVSPEVLEKVLTELATERTAMADRMAKSGEQLRASNEKLIDVLNRASENLKLDAVGLGIEGAIKESSTINEISNQKP
jgi:uncharacterized protein YaaN involved in tellurite resistance